MKHFCRLTLTMALIATVLFGCDSTVVEKQSQSPILQAKIEEGDHFPQSEVLAPVVSDLKDLSDNVVGTLDITNDANYTYLRTSFSHGWQLKTIKIFLGDHSDLPKLNGGMMDLEEFPLKFALAQPQMVNTISVNRGSLGNCFDVCIWFHAVQLNFFGQEVAQIDGWAHGTSVLNGFYKNYCNSSNSNVEVDHNTNEAPVL